MYMQRLIILTMKTRDNMTLLAMLEITGAYTGKALVKHNNMNESISIIRHVFVLDIFNFFCNVTFSAM